MYITENKLKIIDYDVIYLSYDEPNAEKNYADLLTKVPWAKRVHGVEGSDAAHKACAELSETDRFITVDGDNQINPEFIMQELYFRDDIDLDNRVISWSGYNIINGLTYGNGGIKCWPKDVVLNMRTHEKADPDDIQSQVDFCWNLEYLQINKTYSTVHNNATPQQAWRAGFREGVKMCLLEGLRTDDVNRIPKKNLDRLRIWQTVGMDVENGQWAIYGAREGAYKTLCTDWNYVDVRDFETLNRMWQEQYSTIDEDMLRYEIMGIAETLRHETALDIPVDPYEAEQSKFFKSLYTPPKRVLEDYTKPQQSEEYDIVMITYHEPNAEENYQALLDRFPRAKRVDGVKGIHQAHIEAAKLCNTDLIWIVDGDAVIADDFHFDYVAPQKEKHFVKVWRSRNPINDLEYGYGGIKLFPRQATLDMDTSRPDMTTSISRHFKPIKVVSNITAFNTGPFETWKSAFRECAKLSAKVIDRQKTGETDERLKTWTTVGHDRPFGEYSLAGAAAGMEFGLSSGADLRLINDFDWLEQQFDIAYPQETIADTETKAEEIVDLLDRFEYMYEGLSNVRRLYNDKDVSSIFKMANNEDLRKAVMEQNLYSMSRLLPELRDEFKLLQHDKNALWRLLEKYTNSLFVPALKKLQDQNIDMDCFSRGQIKSKKWLVNTLTDLDVDLGTIFLCAGWYATIVPMLSEANIKFDKIRSFDIDDSVWKIAETFNQHLKDDWRFKAQTKDIMDINYIVDIYTTIKGNGDVEQCKDSPDTIINTSCEHIANFDEWFAKIPDGKLVVLQSNNYYSIEEHVNCVKDSLHFEQMAPLSEVYFAGELPLEKYTRFMLIGRK